MKMLGISLYPCNPFTSPVPCADPTNPNQTLEADIAANGNLYAAFLPLTTGFNPTEKNATFKFTYKDTSYIGFAPNSKAESIMFINPYELKTDVSVLPFEEKEVEKGFFFAKTLHGFRPRDPFSYE